MSEPVYPFSCGSQFADWTWRNCQRCRRVDLDAPSDPEACAIDDALLTALIGDGTVTPEIAERMGAVDQRAYTWDCPERLMMPGRQLVGPDYASEALSAQEDEPAR